MPINRYYSDQSLVTHEEILLEKEEAHHLATVTRGKVGERVEIVNGKNTLAHAVIKKIGKKEVVLTLVEVLSFPPPSTTLILAQAMPRQNRMDLILEKGCELGVHAFWFFQGEKSEKITLNEERAKKITLNALKQCGRLDLPTISVRPPLAQWEAFPSPSYFGDTDPKAPFFSSCFKKNSTQCFFIGPESGFSKNELTILRKGSVEGVRLHPHILRTETASLMACSLISHWNLTNS